MKIASIEALPLRIPPAKGTSVTAGLDVSREAGTGKEQHYHVVGQYRAMFSDNIETVIVKVTTEDGLVGWGESGIPIAPQIGTNIIEELFSPFLIGRDPRDIYALWSVMYDAMRDRGNVPGFVLEAIAGVDIALWDLTGKALGVPVYQLLGGARRKSVPVYLSGLDRPTLEERVAYAREMVGQGFKALKIFLGKGVAEDVENVRALREALGDDVTLLVDVQWLYDTSTAIELGRALQKYGVFWLETPSNPEDITGHARIAEALDLRVAIGESYRTRYQFLSILQAGAGDVLQPDIGRAGGITEIRRILELGEVFHVPFALHWGIGLASILAASIHVSLACPGLLYLEYQPMMHEMTSRFNRRPLRCERGHLLMPEGPGLGIDIDEAEVRKYVIDATESRSTTAVMTI
jgi:galactonate dehydratase